MEDLLSIQDWFYANKLTLNLSKTVYLFFEHKGHTKTDLDLTLNGVTIPRKRQTKFLGVWLDDQLNWKHHMQNLITRLSSRMGLVKRQELAVISSEKGSVLWSGTQLDHIQNEHLGNISFQIRPKAHTDHTKQLPKMH